MGLALYQPRLRGKIPNLAKKRPHLAKHSLPYLCRWALHYTSRRWRLAEDHGGCYRASKKSEAELAMAGQQNVFPPTQKATSPEWDLLQTLH